VRGKTGRPSPLDRIEEARIRGLEVFQFEKGIGGNTSKSATPQVTPGDIASAKARIVEALAKAGKSAPEIEEYLTRISPHLDVYALATNDPTSQALLYSRVMSGNGQSGLKDIVETIKLVNDLRGPQQQQSDPAGMISAVAKVFEVAQRRNPERDPVETFNAAVQTVAPFINQQNESLKTAYQGQIDMLKLQLEQNRGTDPLTVLKQWHETGQQLGLIGQPESDEIKLHRLQGLEEDRKRAYELERERWQHELRTKEEDRRQKAQNSMMQQVVGSIEKIVESPVVKELGKNVGNKIGMPANPLAQAKTQAAQNQLSDPLSTPYSFTCGKCKKDFAFSAGQLTKISEAGGTWLCPSEGCHEVYRLKDHDKKGSGAGGPGSSTF
jgi:hypothetical protein